MSHEGDPQRDRIELPEELDKIQQAADGSLNPLPQPPMPENTLPELPSPSSMLPETPVQVFPVPGTNRRKALNEAEEHRRKIENAFGFDNPFNIGSPFD